MSLSQNNIDVIIQLRSWKKQQQQNILPHRYMLRRNGIGVVYNED